MSGNMPQIHVRVTGAQISIEASGPLTSGMVGVPVRLTYDEAWVGLNKTVVFTAGCISRDVLHAEGEVVVPPEVLAIPNQRLYVGVYGSDDGGTLVIPTLLGCGPMILRGTDPSGDESTAPELPVWAQLQAQIDALKDAGGGNIAVDTDGDAIVIKTSLPVTTDGDAIVIGGA